MISMVAEQKSHICLEDDNISATDRYFNLQSIYTHCLEDENMKFQKGMIPWNKDCTAEDDCRILIGVNHPQYSLK